MKKYLLLLLIPFLTVGFLNITQMSEDDIIIKVYEDKINETFKLYFEEFGTEFSSEELEYAWILSEYGINFTIHPDPEGSKILKYWDYIGNYSKGLNCDKYSGSDYIKCITLKLKAGEDSEILFDILLGIEPSSYHEIRLMVFAFEVNGINRDFIGRLEIPCEKFSKFYSDDEPDDVCEHGRKALMLWFCFGDDSELRNVAYREPKNLGEFSCYFRTYLNFKYSKFLD